MFWELLAQLDGADGAAEPTADAAETADQAIGSTGNIIADAQALIDSSLEYVSTQGVGFVINLIAAIAIFVIGRWVVMFLSGWLRRILERSKVDETLVKFAANLAYAFMLTMVCLAALNRLGINTTSLAAVLAAAGLAVGLALQGSLSNFAAGVMLILFKPFGVGDFIEAGGASGVVEEIQIFSTHLRTFDNIKIIVPNSAVYNGKITNFSAKPTRRIDLMIGCGYDDDLRAVKQFLEELVASDERILAEPAAAVMVDSLGDNSVNLAVRPWVNSSDFGAVKSALTEAIKIGFDERGFTFPYPSRDVYMHNTSGD